MLTIGVPKEIKTGEGRVALTPDGARTLRKMGFEVRVEAGAGHNSGFHAYGTEYTAREVWECDLILKVKEPQATEISLIRPGQTIFTYLHLAASRNLTIDLIRKGVTAIAYENVEIDGTLPLLIPMSEIAGRLAPQMGAHCLTDPKSKGMLLGGAIGVKPANVLIIGAGTAGINAARIAYGMGANVTIMDVNLRALARVNGFNSRIQTMLSTPTNIEKELLNTDLLILAVLLPGGAAAPKIIKLDMLRPKMKGMVLVDISIDQGGASETSVPTSHDHPTYVDTGVVHYCVTNIPGAVPKTSTLALTNATFPFIRELAIHLDNKVKPELFPSPLLKAVNMSDGILFNRAVGEAHGIGV